ncbi:unnamed protein product [Vicia faba]|uniref:Uncharacterized protein n=1 Tax=Vicia faba TaxID=3906 RepID=A0AAV1A9R9_VICFA|nr:unnamed protein product [Vicia faba]
MQISISFSSPFLTTMAEADQRFRSEVHAEQFRELMTQNVIEEKSWVLNQDELLEVTVILKKQKLTYLNKNIQLVAKELVMEFYANAYCDPSDEDSDVTQLVYRVRGKEIRYDWQTINDALKCK